MCTRQQGRGWSLWKLLFSVLDSRFVSSSSPSSGFLPPFSSAEAHLAGPDAARWVWHQSHLPLTEPDLLSWYKTTSLANPGTRVTSQGPGHDVISYWWTRTRADFFQLSKKEQCVNWRCVLCSTKPSDLLLSHLYDVHCRTAQGCIHITEKLHTTYCLFKKKKNCHCVLNLFQS